MYSCLRSSLVQTQHRRWMESEFSVYYCHLLLPEFRRRFADCRQKDELKKKNVKAHFVHINFFFFAKPLA